MKAKVDNTWRIFTELPEERKKIAADFILKLKEGYKNRKLREEIDNRRTEIKKREIITHNDFWKNI